MTNETLTEAWDLHPRVAYWLTQKGLVYIHEFRTSTGVADFIAIDPPSGHISVVECKLDISSIRGYYAGGQVSSYHWSLGVPSASKWLVSFTEPLDSGKENFKENGIEHFKIEMDAPIEYIRPRAQQIAAFREVYERLYPDTPLCGLPKASDKPQQFSFLLKPNDPIEGRILEAIRDKIAEHSKTRPSANIKTVLMDWLKDYLGFKDD